MFSKLFGKNRKKTHEDRWCVATGADGEMPLIFRIRKVSPEIKRKAFPQLLAISWEYNPEEGGMPSSDAKKRMDLLEELLERALEDSGNAMLTVVVTGNGIREWQWYSKSVDKTMSHINSALAGHEVFPIQISNDDDLFWDAYSQFEALL